MIKTSEQWTDTLPTSNQLRWACRRGLLELDLLLETYMDKVYDKLTDHEKRMFISMLDMQDQDMYEMLVGKTSPNDEEMAKLLINLRESLHS